MLKIEMPQITTKGLVIPGGWIAKVPEVEIEGPALAVFVSYLMKRKALRPAEAEAEARAAHQSLYTYGYLTSLSSAVRYRARQYQKKYGTLEGFDPVLVAKFWMPRENVGRRGKPFVQTLMAQMQMATGGSDE